MFQSTKSLNAAGSQPLRIVLMACWGIGRSLLESLATDPRVEVVAVLTRSPNPDDPWAGVVYEMAFDMSVPVYLFDKMDEKKLLNVLQSDVDLMIVHAYPKRLSVSVYNAPPLGTVNVHPSLLPRYRGRKSTLFALADGATETGLTAHFMDDGFDTGPIIHQERIPIFENDTVNTVIERLKIIAPPLMQKTVTRVIDRNFKPKIQADTA